jgi:membrane associated rhomboid family serine protease
VRNSNPTNKMESLQKPMLMGVAGALVVVSLLQFVLEDATEKLGLVAVNTFIMNSYVWNIVTCPFYETNWGKLIIELSACLYVFRNLNFPSLEQFGVYLVGCILCSSFCTSAYTFVKFFVTHVEDVLVAPTYGFSGIFISFALFARQQLGSQPLVDTVPFLTYNNLIIIVIAVQTICLLIGFTGLAVDITLSMFSLLFGWSYLRFYYRFSEESAELGDKSEDFSFVSMFPSVRRQP